MAGKEQERHPWPQPVLRLAGEGAVHIAFESLSPDVAPDAVLALDGALAAAFAALATAEGSGHALAPLAAAVIEQVPTIRALTVFFDPGRIKAEAALAALEAFVAAGAWRRTRPRPGAEWEIPAVYGGDAGPDLAPLAEMLRMSPEEVVRRHAAARQRVTMLGFAPGSAYLDGLPALFDVPRRRELRPIPAGAVIVALRQTVLTSVPMPTGWYHIATTPLRLFDPARRWPFLLAPADRLRLVPITPEEAEALDPKPFWQQAAAREQRRAG